MILERFLQKQRAKHLRLRVESCVSTILDLNKYLGEGKIKPEVIEQFEKLRDSLHYLTDETVNEGDIHRIEEATNQLLAEMKPIFEKDPAKSLHSGHLH